ncbi:MAG TPA: polyprenyl synthetase family protein [Gemmatimonadaceae bacterium]|nr:polyprenyl synthetase family protein [Gemmatimonadaceae bacterium]
MGCWSFAISTHSRTTAIDSLADREAIEAAIADVCATDLAGLGSPVGQTIAYALSGGGKRLRGLLVLAAYRAAGGSSDASRLAAAVEILHSYSLVHDDLPCMDDDDMRRGRLSAHRAFTVKDATAAGATMIPLAVKTAHDAARRLRLPEHTCCTIVKVLMRAAGAGGMIGGQLLDLEAEGMALSREELDVVHAAKTGALITASAIVGALAAQAEDDQIRALDQYGTKIGLAFQIMDDVLDVTSSTAKLGKTAGRDAQLGKSTYPALLGVKSAIARAEALVEESRAALHTGGVFSAELDGIASFIVSRSH